MRSIIRRSEGSTYLNAATCACKFVVNVLLFPFRDDANTSSRPHSAREHESKPTRSTIGGGVSDGQFTPHTHLGGAFAPTSRQSRECGHIPVGSRLKQPHLKKHN